MEDNNRKIRQEPDENKKPRRKQRRINIGVIVEIYKLLPAVLNKLFPVPVEMLKWDKGFWFDPNEIDFGEEAKYRDVILFPQTCPISQQDLIDHFLQKIISERIEKDNVLYWNPELFEGRDNVLSWRGELFIELKDRDTNHVKSFCLRSYGEEDMEQIDDKLLPVLDGYSVDYVIHRLENELRLWMFCDTSVWLLNLFIRKILDEADIVTSLGLQIASIGDPETIPIPGGYSLHNDSVGSVEFRGETGNDAIFIMQSILECNLVSEMQMLAILREPIQQESI